MPGLNIDALNGKSLVNSMRVVPAAAALRRRASRRFYVSWARPELLAASAANWPRPDPAIIAC